MQNDEHEKEVQYMMSQASDVRLNILHNYWFKCVQAKVCSNRVCIEFRIQHRNATIKNLEMERNVTAIRLKYDMLFDQVTTQGAAATARAAESGEDAFRLPNGELMTAEKFMERTRMLSQARVALDRSEISNRKHVEEISVLNKEKEAALSECRR